jgi:GTPase SAR1 family protein
MGDWLNDLQTLSAPNAYVLLVGNKADLEKDRQVSEDVVRQFAERQHLETIETSALTGRNVAEAFARLSLEVSTRVSNGSIVVNTVTGKEGGGSEGLVGKKEKGGCCGYKYVKDD